VSRCGDRRKAIAAAVRLTGMTLTMRSVRRPAASSERALVLRAQAGDARAFDALIEMHDRTLRGLAFRLPEDRFAMQDVMQVAYVSAYRAIGSFSRGSAIGTWLYRIVYYACMDELRRRPRRAHVCTPLGRKWDREIGEW